MKKLYTIACLAILCLGAKFSSYAQADLSTHFLYNDWRAAYTNPALIPEGLTIALPGVYNNLLLTNVTYNDLFTTDDAGQQVFDIDNVISNLGDDNILRENLDFETIGIGYTLGPVTLSLGHRLRYTAFAAYPKTLPQLIWEGNAQFIGETVDFSTDIDLLGYHEFAFGAMVKVNDKLRLSGRVKSIHGFANATTERNRLALTTDNEIYELSLDADWRVNSTGTLGFDGINDISADFNFGDFNTSDFFSANSGLAFDIGAVLDLGPLRLTASALDIGGEFSWEEDVSNYSLSGIIEFEGLDAAQAIFDEDVPFGDILDTLEQLYEPTESFEPYKTQLPSRYYLSGQYFLNDKFSVGALFYMENYRDETRTAAAVSGNVQLSSLLRLGAIYSIRNERFDNLGANAILALGPARLVLATDNLITAFRPKDVEQAQFRIGLGLQFDKKDSAETGARPLY